MAQEDLRKVTDVAVAGAKTRIWLNQNDCTAVIFQSTAAMMAGKRPRAP